MKKYFYMAVAAIAVLSSCDKENAILDGNGNGVDIANAPVFTATIEGGGETKTQLVEGSTAGKLTKVNWLGTDKVNVHGAVYAVTPGDPATTATLTRESGETPALIDGKYYAVYPSTIAFNTSTKTITLPATQTYDATTNGIGNVPMVAVSENTTLQFKNICAVLAITVPSGTVKAIKVMADKKNLSGDFTLDPSTSAITATTTGSNTVVLDCGEGVAASNTTFYVAIPPQEYSSLQIYLSADGTTYKEAMATKVAAGLGTLARNNIFPITYAKNAVQLWADGPYFATTNVGGTQKYQWGATVADGTGNWTAASSGAITANTYDLNHDTAYKIWGSAWRMPTQAECAALLDNCNYSFDNSAFILSSTSGYGSISFPVEDRGNSYDANYCTSTVHNNGWPYLLNFMVSSGGSQFANASGTSSPADVRYVRAVLATPAAAPVPDPNLLAGVFSVSATKKVKFTKGNLWCNTTTTPVTWAFETNQYDYPVGTDYTSDGTGSGTWLGTHVGHFFWSNYTDYNRTDEHAHDYKPYYSSFGASSKATSDEFWCSEDHKLEVAGTQGLYVLSSDEWDYLLNIPINYNEVGRTQTNRFAKARVNGKAGLLIFPDGYNGTTTLTGITGMCTINDDYEDAYPGESIPTDTWSDMEAAGVVFLPAAGYRGVPDGQSISSGNCQYWSSTPYSSKDYAYGLYGADYGEFQCPGKIKREYGSSIRLVKTVE